MNSLTVLQPRVLRCHNRGLGSSAFDRLYLRNHVCFLFLLLLRCFSSQGLPSDLCQSTPCGVGCPIRKSADQWVFAPPRSLSQLITSFFASESQGILYVPLSPFFMIFEILAVGVLAPTALSVARLFSIYVPECQCALFQNLSNSRRLAFADRAILKWRITDSNR